MTLLVGIDIGTSACKVGVYRPDGHEVAAASVGYPLYTPRPGHVEQHPDEWRDAAFRGLRAVTSHPDVDPAAVAGVAVAGQSWAAVPVDAHGRALARTPIWMDTRSTALCDAAVERIGHDALFALTGNRLSATYSTGKLLWFREHAPEVFRSARWFLQSNAWIVHALTGVPTTDVSQGYGLHFVDVASSTYNPAMCEALGLRLDQMPELVECTQVVGAVSAAAAAATGLATGTPVVAGGLDAACAALGAGVHRPGAVQEQGGQAGGMSIVVDRPTAHESLILSRHVVPGVWLLQGGTAAGGASLRWLVEQVGAAEELAGRARDESTYALVSELAGGVPPGSDGLVFLPYLAGERSPLWAPDATGVFFGLTLATTRGHFYRAVMEGVAYSLQHNLLVAAQTGAQIGTLHAVGGAATSHVWTQIKADVTGRSVSVPRSPSATTLGAAILAGLGTGVWADPVDAIADTVRMERTHAPDPATAGTYAVGYRVYRDLYERLAPLMTAAARAARPPEEAFA